MLETLVSKFAAAAIFTLLRWRIAALKRAPDQRVAFLSRNTFSISDFELFSSVSAVHLQRQKMVYVN